MQFARWNLVLLSVCTLAGCLTVGVGPLTIGSTDSSGLPLLYADPGVRVLRVGTGDIEYRPGLVLLHGDSVSTADGQAVIDFDDSHVVALQSNTTIELGSIRLFIGELFARMERLVQRGGARVETNELTASVEGTEYAVRRTRGAAGTGKGTSTVIVRRGTVRCDPVAGADWQPVGLRPNQMFEVYGLRAPSAVRRIDAQAETRWADEAIERLLQSRSIRPTVGIGIPVGGTASGRRDEPPLRDGTPLHEGNYPWPR